MLTRINGLYPPDSRARANSPILSGIHTHLAGNQREAAFTSGRAGLRRALTNTNANMSRNPSSQDTAAGLVNELPRSPNPSRRC